MSREISSIDYLRKICFFNNFYAVFIIIIYTFGSIEHDYKIKRVHLVVKLNSEAANEPVPHKIWNIVLLVAF